MRRKTSLASRSQLDKGSAPSSVTSRERVLQMSADSVEQLPPTARRILAAARRILRKRGFAAMSLQAVANEADQVKPTIAYYFGNKAGLVSMIVKSLMSESTALAKASADDSPPSEARVLSYIDGIKQLSMHRDTTMEFLEILPWAARHEEMGPAMQNLYSWAGEYNAKAIANLADNVSADDLLPCGVLMAAVLDGLAIQKVVGVEDAVLDRAWEQWRKIVLLVGREHAEASRNRREDGDGVSSGAEVSGSAEPSGSAEASGSD